jgi:hypothetical protein
MKMKKSLSDPNNILYTDNISKLLQHKRKKFNIIQYI